MTQQPTPGQDETYPSAPIFQSPLRIGANGTTILATPAITAEIRHAIVTTGGAVFHDVIEPSLLRSLIEVSNGAGFRQVDLAQYGLRGNDLSARSAMPFCAALGRPVLMRWLERIAGCEPIAHVEGHLVQMLAGNNLGWHRDAGLGIRRLALVLNLTAQPYQGGYFELRQRKSHVPMLSYQARSLGSLAIFRLANDLEHQVTRVEAGGPRVTFSGWARGPWCAGDLARDGALATWPPLIPGARAT